MINQHTYCVKYPNHLILSGVQSVKELLSTLTSDERWGVMLEFEDVDPAKFSQLFAVAPDWVQWME